MRWPWPKIEWNLRLDPIALTALTLAAGAAIAQVIAWAGGSSVRLIAPDRVAFYSDVMPDRSIAVRLAAHMSYANVAQAPYGDLVLKERVQLRVGSLASEQQWNAFGTLTRDGPQMIELAAPQPLPSQSAVSHFTLFVPPTLVCPTGSRDCNSRQHYITPDAFLTQLDRAEELQLNFEIELIDGQRERTSCHVPITEQSREQLSKVPTSYAYLLCRPDRDA